MEGISHLISDLRITEEILDMIQDAVAVLEKKDDRYTYTYMNKGMIEKWGDLTGHSVSRVHSAPVQSDLYRAMGEADQNREAEYTSADIPYFSIRVKALASSSVYLLVGSERSYINSALNDWEQNRNPYEPLIENSPDSVLVHDQRHKVIYANTAAAKLFGVERADEIVGKSIFEFVFEDAKNAVIKRVNKLFSGKNVEGLIEMVAKRIDGEPVYIEMHGGLVDYQGISAVQTICRNITERRLEQSKLVEMAYYDQLTKVSNRRYFFDHLENEIKNNTEADRTFSILFIDMDNFKEINDRYGHHIGDDVLIIFTKRVKQLLRESDTISRLGGDEFVVLLSDLKSPDDALHVADRMMERITAPIVINGETLTISVSIGISTCPDHGTTKEMLLTRADEALYTAKKNGRKCIEVYAP